MQGWQRRAADKVEALLKEGASGAGERLRPLCVGVVGISGSGKSTGSAKLCEELSKRKIKAAVVPMDGFHIPLDRLREMGADAVCRCCKCCSRTLDRRRLRRLCSQCETQTAEARQIRLTTRPWHKPWPVASREVAGERRSCQDLIMPRCVVSSLSPLSSLLSPSPHLPYPSSPLPSPPLLPLPLSSLSLSLPPLPSPLSPLPHSHVRQSRETQSLEPSS